MRTPTAESFPMRSVMLFPRELSWSGASGVRVAYVADYWCVERLANGVIPGRTRMPTRADAERIAARITRRDKLALLAPSLTSRTRGHFAPGGDAA